MKKYYLHQSRRISTKKFKILHLPKDIDETTIKDAIRALLKAFPFYIRTTGGTKSLNKKGHIMLFFTVKDTQGCHLLKNQ